MYVFIHCQIISIHAPARGATCPQTPIDQEIRNFNPRSREGSDQESSSGCYIFLHFNPRSREGSDVLFADIADRAEISIHAPARGATVNCGGFVVSMMLFQSTLPRGERLLMPAEYRLTLAFQSTLPRGERRPLVHATIIAHLFQSTLPRGERHDCYINPGRGPIISIHAPARGATRRLA